MSAEPVITLYDTASRSDKALGWNPFILRSRYALNVKKLPYKIVLLEYLDIEPTLGKLGAKPTGAKPDGSPLYTLPVIVDPLHPQSSGEPTIVSNAWDIAEYLDKAYPDRIPLFPPGTKVLQRSFHDAVWAKIFSAAAPIIVPAVHEILNERSRDYWRRTREPIIGEKIEEMCPKGTPKFEERWATVEKAFGEVSKLLSENGSSDGLFVMGNQVSYADLTILAVLQALFTLAPESWEGRGKNWDGGRWAEMRSTCTKLGYVR